MDYLPPKWTETEKQDIKDLANANPTFLANVVKKKIDYTAIIKDELLNILYGKIPRNFIINIKNNIGSPTGVFKSSFGLQLALEFDPTFVVKERVAFTPNQLNDLVKQFAKRKQVFLLDERIHDLKQSADLRLANIAESCRERQICIIMVGVAERFLNISHYHLERFGESGDDYLPNKTVYYLVKKITENRRIYRGFIKHNVLPLTDPVWNSIWSEYMELKSAHQDAVIDQKVSAFDFEIKAKEFGTSVNFIKDCVTREGLLVKQLVKNHVYKSMPDVTNEERKMVITELVFSTEKYLKLLPDGTVDRKSYGIKDDEETIDDFDSSEESTSLDNNDDQT